MGRVVQVKSMHFGVRQVAATLLIRLTLHKLLKPPSLLSSCVISPCLDSSARIK